MNIEDYENDAFHEGAVCSPAGGFLMGLAVGLAVFGFIGFIALGIAIDQYLK